MTRTRWLLTLAPALASVALYAAMLVAWVLPVRPWDRSISWWDGPSMFAPDWYEPGLLVAALLPALAALPARPLGELRGLLLPALYVAVLAGWEVARRAVFALA